MSTRVNFLKLVTRVIRLEALYLGKTRSPITNQLNVRG